MNRTDAKRLMDALKKFDVAFNEATEVTVQMGNQDHAKEIRKELAVAYTGTLLKLRNRILLEYPDLEESDT